MSANQSDYNLTPDQLREKYDTEDGWGNHPDPVYDMAEWRREVENEDTRLGYWDWVAGRLFLEQDGGEEA